MKSIKTTNLVFVCIIFLYSFPQDLLAQSKLDKLLVKGDYQKAEEYCNKQEGSTQKICFNTLGDYYFNSREYKKSAVFYEKTDNKNGFEKLGDKYFEFRKYENSIFFYEKAYSESLIMMKETYIKLANAFFATDDFENAVKLYEKAYVDEGDKLLETYKIVGNEFFEVDEYDKAGELFAKAEYKPGLESIGDVYFKRDDVNNAKKYFDQASEIYKIANEKEKNSELYYYDIWTDKGNKQVYKTVTIGSQVWMAENLKITNYNDGTPIRITNNDEEWSQGTAAYCWYQFDSRYASHYGNLYNWYAVNTGKLCPVGWHVPSKLEWDTLESFLRQTLTFEETTDEHDYNVGGLLKEPGLDHWDYRGDNVGATNKSGFSALPGGYATSSMKLGQMQVTGVFKSKESLGLWHTSTVGQFNNDLNDKLVIHYTLFASGTGSRFGEGHKGNGYSVRCVMD